MTLEQLKAELAKLKAEHAKLERALSEAKFYIEAALKKHD